MFVITKLGRRLCYDGRLRGHANFGSYPSCVKVYDSEGWANRAALKIKGEVVEVPKGHYMDAAGGIYPAD